MKISILILLSFVCVLTLFAQSTAPVIKDNFNRAVTPNIANQNFWKFPTNVPFPDSIRINADSTASFHGNVRNQLVWDTSYQSRARAGVVIKQRSLATGGGQPQDESIFIYFLDSKDYNNCHGYAVGITDPNWGTKWSQFTVYAITPNPFSGTVIAQGYDTLAVGDTLLFGIDNFSQSLTFEVWHNANYAYANQQHFKLAITDYTYDFFLNPYYIWLRGADYEFIYGQPPYKFDNFMIGADARLHIPTTAPNPVITSWNYIPGGGVDSLTPFRWQISAVDTFKISKIVIVQNGVRTDSIPYPSGQHPRIARWTSKATTVSRSGLSYSGYAIVYNDSGKTTQSATKSFTTVSRSFPWVLAYFPWWFENRYTPLDLPWKSMTHVVDFDAFNRGTLVGTSPTWYTRTDTAPYFYWQYRLDTSFSGHKAFRDSMMAIAHRQVPPVKVLAGYSFFRQWEIWQQGDSITRVWAHHISDTLKKYKYDGFALDFEPMPDDAVQVQWFNAVGILRDTLDAWPVKGILFAAPMSYPFNPGFHYSFPDNLELCDRIAVQEYDQGGYWSTGTTYNSPIFPPDTSVSPWHNYSGGSDSSGIANWLPQLHYKSRVLFGMPLYGRTFHGTSQPNSLPNNLYNFQTYDSIVNFQLTDIHSTRVFDNKTKVPYITNTSSLYWTTYEDIPSLRLKVDYAAQIGLGGVMTFDLGDGALLTVPPGHTKNELQDAVWNEAMNVFIGSNRTPKRHFPLWVFKQRLDASTRILNGVTVSDTFMVNNTADTSNHGLNNISWMLDSILVVLQTEIDSVGQSTGGLTASNLANQYLTGFKTFGPLRSDSIIEGNVLFFTNARARAALSVIAPILYNSSTGVFSLDTTTLYTGIATLYQNSLKENKLPAGGTVNQYLNAFRKFVALNSDSMAEGVTNLFFTNARARLAFTAAGPATYNNATGVHGVDTTTANISAVSKFQIRYALGMIGPSVLGVNITGFGVDSTYMLRGDQRWVKVKHYHFPISPSSDSVIISDAWLTTLNVGMATGNWGYFGAPAQANSGPVIVEVQNGLMYITWSSRNQPANTYITVSAIGR